MAARIISCVIYAFTLYIATCTATADDNFIFSNGPVPDPFQLHQHYPDRSETDECRPIRLRIGRSSRRFQTDLVTNSHPSVQFANADARIMSSRLQRYLNELADLFHEQYNVWLSVTKAWVEYGDENVTDPNSLHFEGRTVRVSVSVELISPLLRLAVEVGFDWVLYAAEDYVRMSVIPDLCDVALDVVFMLDRSGSVGEGNFETAISFVQGVVSFFTIASDETRVGVVPFSDSAVIEFDLNDFQTTEDVTEALGDVVYTKGRTATALALALTRFMLDPQQDYGARPFSDGIPKVAILITDGRSNELPITDRANALRNFGVQVYTVGIANINLRELRFIASDPDEQHVFLLNSFSDAAGFVDLLSFTTCDTPAVVEPGEDTRTEIEEDEFRFFQSRCAAFSQTIMIEQIDFVGRCSLYASSTVQNPGPLDPSDSVARNETSTTTFRSVHLSLPHNADNRFVYVSVLGRQSRNEFSIVIWDMIFQQDEYTITILDGGDTTGREIINLVDEIGMTDASFNFAIASGNEDGLFALGSETGVLTVTQQLDADTHSTFQLNIVAQNQEHACHRSKVVVIVVVAEEIFVFNPAPQPVAVVEDAGVGTLVTQISATSSGTGELIYGISAGNIADVFTIDQATGVITVAGLLDFETTPEYSLTVQATSEETGNVIMALQVITITDVNETPFFVTECATTDICMFTVPENEPSGIFVGTVEAGDPDSSSTPNGMLTYSLEPDTVPFEVSSSGEIRTTQSLDFEIVPSYSFMLMVQDGGSAPSPRIQTPVTVEVVNVEENRVPVFMTDCSISALESIPVGTAFLQCVASDADEDGTPIFDLVYEIVSGNIDDTFAFDPNMGAGVLVIARALDREQRDLYTLTVSATDPGGLAGTTTVQVVVIDVNDNPPTCQPPMDPITIATDDLPRPPDRTVTTFTAVDLDLNPLPPVFSIDSQVIDPEATSAVVTVRVTDGADSTLSSTCTLTLQFDASCFEQRYAIDVATGRLSSELLCSANILPSDIEIEFGTSRLLMCFITRNVPVSLRFFHNGTAITDSDDLTDSEESGDVIRFQVSFSFSGEYECQVFSDLGTLTSPSATVRIVVAPVITMPPSDVEVQVGTDMVEFQCIASGIPDPVISWFRPNEQEPIGPGEPRFTPMGDTLRITAIESGDAGEYTCEASNSDDPEIDSATATAVLTVFSTSQLVVAEVPEYFVPSLDSSCHEFNTTDFNSVLTDITGYTTLTTDQVSDDLCPPSPCNPSPCQNKGVCVTDLVAVGGYVCHCPSQFTGRNCENVTDPCKTGPCMNDGLCASTSQGVFICTCSDGYHGDRCQYTAVCSVSAPCREDETCVETVVTSEGYVCVDVEGGGGAGVTVTVGSEGGESMTSSLNGEVNLYIETAAANDGDENDDLKENGFVTVCEGRFIPAPATPDTLVLVWACPDGVAAPGEGDEEAICDLLIEQRLVASCTSSLGGRVDLPPPRSIPPTGVNITFILIDPFTNLPLSAAEVLVILEDSDALTRLATTSYRARRFSAVVRSSSSTSNDSGMIAGAVIGTLVAVTIVAVVMVTVMCVVQRRRSNKNKTSESEAGFPGQQNVNGTMNSVTFSNRYNQMKLDASSSMGEGVVFQPQTREDIFDDPVYEAGFTASNSSYRPPATKKKSSSLERGMKVLKSKVTSSTRHSDLGSQETLLAPLDDSGDYDDIAASSSPPPRPPKPSVNHRQTDIESSDDIYANFQHQQAGAMGNAGQRWMSYWQNRTLIRTSAPEPDTTKK